MKYFHKFSFRSFRFLNATQFLGALNDNVFKLLVIFFLINARGASNANTILAVAGAIFVVPFLFFSATAGILADKLSKRAIIVSMKFTELFIMSLSVIAIYFKSGNSLYVLLFLMATQSAFFGPSKYGIIPEIVAEEKISKANGLLTSFTFLAIIIGTFLASFITDITNKNFFITSFACIIIAFCGCITSLGIEKTQAQRSTKKFNPLFIYEIYKTLTLCYKRKFLLPSVIASGFFLFVGSFAQLNTIPFAIQSLHLSEVGGGYLFLTTAIGIAIGSVIAGKLCKDKIPLGMSCLSGLFMSVLLVILTLVSKFLIPVIIILITLGICGGIYLIPIESFIQINSPDIRRGQVIAASNFLSFFGVLLASFALYLFGDVLKLSSAMGFLLMGVIAFIFNGFLSARMSDQFFPYLSEKIFLPFIAIKTTSTPQSKPIFIFIKNSWIEALLLFSIWQNLRLVTVKKNWYSFPFFSGFFNTLFLIKKSLPAKEKANVFIEKYITNKEPNTYLCLFLQDKEEAKDIINHVKENYHEDILDIKTEKHFIPLKYFGITYRKKLLAISFSKNTI